MTVAAGGGGVNGLGCQYGDIAPVEGVGLSTGKIVLLTGHRWYEDHGTGWGRRGGWELPEVRKCSNLLAALIGSVLRK